MPTRTDPHVPSHHQSSGYGFTVTSGGDDASAGARSGLAVIHKGEKEKQKWEGS